MEKRGGSMVQDPFQGTLEYLISKWDLIDIKPKRGKYTWIDIRVRLGHVMERLDRFLKQINLIWITNNLSQT